MNTNISKLFFAVAILFAVLPSCRKQDDIYKEYVKVGGYVYPAKPIEESYNKKVLNIFKGKAKFLVSPLMDKNAAVLGASALGWEE